MTALLLPVLVCAEEQKLETPREYSAQDMEKSKEHFDRIIGQVDGSPKTFTISDKAGTMDQAFKALQNIQVDISHPLKFFSSVEYRGWFIFSTAASGYSEEEAAKDPRIMELQFHSGYAVKKGTNQAATFGFW